MLHPQSFYILRYPCLCTLAGLKLRIVLPLVSEELDMCYHAQLCFLLKKPFPCGMYPSTLALFYPPQVTFISLLEWLELDLYIPAQTEISKICVKTYMNGKNIKTVGERVLSLPRTTKNWKLNSPEIRMRCSYGVCREAYTKSTDSTAEFWLSRGSFI